MTVIVNSGTTLTVTNGAGLTIGGNSTVASGGLLDGSGTIAGGFVLLNIGTISADVPGVVLAINTGTLTNQGTIFANAGPLTIKSSVAITNFLGGTLTGGVWEASGPGALGLLSGQIVTDNATIILDGAASVLDGSLNGTLQPIDNSLITIGTAGALSLLNGRNFTASDSLVVAGTLTLGGGTLSAPVNGITIDATGTIIGFGTIDAGTPMVDGGTIEADGGTLALPGAVSVTGLGTLRVDPGASMVLQAFGTYSESIINNGTIDAAFAGLTGTLGLLATYSGSGGFLIQGGPDSADRTVLELPASVSAPVAFDTNFGQLVLDASSTFNGTITGFGNNDTIVLAGLGNAANAALSGGILSVKNGGGGVLRTLTLNVGSEDYSGAVFHVTENTGNTQATIKVSGVQAAACFAAGTRIQTPAGEILVEDLAEGDVVRAHFAGSASVVWIGHRHVDCRRHPERSKVWPVRVSAHAFGPRLPECDLLLSPDHAVFVDDVLIPIKHLINGVTIAREQVDTVTYYHVELAEHDIVTANGMPAESYLENGDRAAFDNGGEAIALYPDFGMRRWEAFGCVRLVVTGPELDAVAARVLARMPKDEPTPMKIRRVA